MNKGTIYLLMRIVCLQFLSLIFKALALRMTFTHWTPSCDVRPDTTSGLPTSHERKQMTRQHVINPTRLLRKTIDQALLEDRGAVVPLCEASPVFELATLQMLVQEHAAA
jgi:hypothetical protein